MAPLTSTMTRTSSSDSSALSNIFVAGTRDDDSASDRVSASTPPTSLNDSGSLGSGKADVDTMDVIEEESGRRPKRARSSVSTYNLKQLSEAQQSEPARSSRNVSGLTGRTLVNEDEITAMSSKVDKDLEMDWEANDGSPQRRSPRQLQRKPSVKDRVKKVAGKAASVLGKRSREVVEAGKKKLGMKDEESSSQQSKALKELETGTKGVLDEMDLSDDEWAAPPPRPAKRAKLDRSELQDTKLTVPTAPPLKIMSGKAVKKWQKEGLYVGQDPNFDPTKPGGRKKLQKKRLGSSASDETGADETTSKKTPLMSLPMFSYLEKTRDFIIPFDIYAPITKKGDEKPKDWYKVNRNRLVGEAKELWEKAEKLPLSVCVCHRDKMPGEQGCGENCLNRVMQYECNDDNCRLPADQCSNRAFAELAARMKKQGSFDVGVEVIKTPNRGFGVRSCRVFAPGQIIMEYSGEIISEGECQRRMREDYKDKQCYYLMELEKGLIIDGTKGSMARFINHSCEPNCEVRMVKVSGTPRMAVFAGEGGIMTGEELTYDYNFDSFGTTKQVCYCGAPNCRGTLSKRLNAAEQKKMAKEESERRKKAAEEAQKRVEAEAKKKLSKDERGSSWRGWVAVDDPETKEQLRREKREREEAEKNSSRAQRLAARSGGLPASNSGDKGPMVKKNDSKRRKTLDVADGADTGEQALDMSNEPPAPKPTTKRTHIHTVSTSSKFTEQLNDSESTRSTSITVKQTEESITTSEEVRLLQDDSAVAGAEDDEADRPVTSTSEKSGLSRTASKGKEALKSVGQAVKGSLLGLERMKSGNGGKLKQSTLSFSKLG